MRKVLLIILIPPFSLLFSCSTEYPEDFKMGTFKTTTDMNTTKFLYRNHDYQYIYSEDHPLGNKLSKISWQRSGYKLDIINKTSAYDSLIQTITLINFELDKSFTETTQAEGIDLIHTSTWIRISDTPDKMLYRILEENGIKLK